MDSVKRQYLLQYGVWGCFMPFLGVCFRARGLSDEHIGVVTGVSGALVAFSPAIATYLADTRANNRVLLGRVYAVSAAFLLMLVFANGFWPVLVIYGLFHLAMAPGRQLNDGLYFLLRRDREAQGLPIAPYHRYRVYGTIGYMVPSLLLWLLFTLPGASAAKGAWADPINYILPGAAVCAALGALNTLALPRTRREDAARLGDSAQAEGPIKPNENSSAAAAALEARLPAEVRHGLQADEALDADAPAGLALEGLAEKSPRVALAPTAPISAEKPAISQVPTLEALRVLMRPDLLVYSLAVGLVMGSAAGYYAFYPRYLVERVHVESRWLGLIAIVGVAWEVPVMLAFGHLRKRFGLSGLIAFGSACVVARMLWLGSSDSLWAGVGTQLLHPFMVLLVHVIPPQYLDDQAEDRFRNSMQGLFAMLVEGPARLLGGVLGGWIAHRHGLPAFFQAAALASLAGAALFALALAMRPRRPATRPG